MNKKKYFTPFLATIPDLDLGFVVGASGMKATEMLDTQKRLIKHMLTSYDVAAGKTHVGVVQKGSKALVAIRLGQYKDIPKLVSEIDNLGVNDMGNLADSLNVAGRRLFSSSYGGRIGGKKSLIVFVSEKLKEDKIALKEAGEMLRNYGVNVIVIGLNEDTEKEDLNAIAPVNDVFFFPPLLDELDMSLYPVVRSTYPGNTLFHLLRSMI